MRRLLLLTDALDLKAGLLDFACYIARQEKSKLVGVFVEEHQLDARPSVKSLGGRMYVEEITRTEDEVLKDAADVARNIRSFQDGCMKREVNSVVHHYTQDVFKSVIHETRYADLMILDPAVNLGSEDTIPSDFAISLLRSSECPVVIAPEDEAQIDEIVFAFDGSKSSVFAIKQFCNFMPQFTNRKITVVHINKVTPGESHNTERALFNEWLAMHFSEVAFVELSGDPQDELFKYFMEQKERNNKMFVTGAYGRSFISSLLKPSAADLVLKAFDFPVFITHF